MNNKSRILTIIIGLFLMTGLYSFKPTGINDDLLQRIIANLDNYNKLLPQEKLYMHIDKPYYIAGEDVYYKTYIVNALFLFQDTNDELVHIELRSKDETISVHKVKASKGSASGTISLPDTLSTGSYTLVGYTNWMRNFSDDFIFSKEINVYQPNQEAQEIPAELQEEVKFDVDVSFFPEGGSLVDGLTSKVGFKAVNQFGKGHNVNGVILDQNNNVITTFNALHTGIGSFILKPSAENRYRAKLILDNGQEKFFDLPVTLGTGAVMQAFNTRNNIKITVQSNIKTSNGQFLLIAQTNGQIYYSATGSEVTKGFLANIPKSELPTGITQLTLFDGEGMPLCERLVFIDKRDTAELAVNQDKSIYTPREKVKLGISLRDFNGAKEGDFSISVTNRVSDKVMQENIETYMMLSSDLRGEIEQPQFYFDRNNAYSAIALDNLLLTQGWRRFTWSNVLTGEFSKPKFEYESGLLVKGTLFDNLNVPLANQRVLISLPNQLVSYVALSDEYGRIERYIYDYYGSEKLIVLPVENTDLYDNMVFVPDEVLTRDIKVNNSSFAMPSDENVLNSIKKELENSEMMQAFDVVTYKEQKSSFNSSLINATTNYRPLYNSTVTLADYISFPNMTEVFREIVPYVNIILKNRKAKLYSLDAENNFKAPPLFFVNGTPTNNIDYVLDLNPGDIESIGVINAFKNLINMGLNGDVGIICVNGKKGRVLPEIPDENNIMAYGGYTLSKEFYSPKYNDDSNADERLPDFRSLLYWNPDVKTNANGDAEIEFYTSDEIGSFEVNIQGITSDGIPVAKSSSVVVSIQ